MNEDRNPSAKTPPHAKADKVPSGTAPTQVIAQMTPENWTQQPPAQEGGPFSIVLGFFTWVAVILWVVWKSSEIARKFLQDWWWAVGTAIALPVIIFWVVEPLRRWFAKAAAEKR